MSWNLFHGRDVPVEIDYRRSLRTEFAALLARLDWDVALLQEAPPRWFDALVSETGARGSMLKTSRNQLGFVRASIADRAPDLIKSNEGGSNQLLVRPPWMLVEERHLTLARLPERRRMQWVRLEHPGGRSLCVANLHASAHRPARAAQELERAAQRALAWSGGEPLLFGGDLNVRPREQPWIFDQLRELGFSGPTGDSLIDHVLAHGLAVGKRPRQLAPDEREVLAPGGARVRLSDHAPVVAAFDMG